MPTQEEMAARLEELRAASVSGVESEGSLHPSDSPAGDLIRGASTICDSLIGSLRVEDGIGLGLADIDTRTRGFRPNDLVIVTGFSHAGKTQLVNTMFLRNPDKRILFFSLDDPAEMILAKLVSMHEGIGAEILERQVRLGDPAVEDLIRKVSKEHLSELRIVDENIGISRMQRAVEAASQEWGAAPHAVVIDYLEMIPGDSQRGEEPNATVKRVAKQLKRWARAAEYPLIVLHQGTRSNSKPGAPITMLSLAFGGEQEATIIVGVRRKRDYEQLEGYERLAHEKTITLHIVKNKRPGGRCTSYDGLDFYMEPSTGLIRELRDGDLQQFRVATTVQPTSAAEAGRTAKASPNTTQLFGRDDV